MGQYALTKLKYGDDLRPIYHKLEEATINKPDDISEEESRSKFKLKKWELTVEHYFEREKQLEQNKNILYGVVWGQSSGAMKAKLQAMKEFKERYATSDCVWLLKAIQSISFSFDAQRYRILALDKAKTSYFSCKQGTSKDISEYYKLFKTKVEIIEHHGVNVWTDQAIIDDEVNEIDDSITDREEILEATENEKKAATKRAKDKTIALNFLVRSDAKKYGKC